jgi:hypothetical protein
MLSRSFFIIFFSLLSSICAIPPNRVIIVTYNRPVERSLDSGGFTNTSLDSVPSDSESNVEIELNQVWHRHGKRAEPYISKAWSGKHTSYFNDSVGGPLGSGIAGMQVRHSFNRLEVD